jgi:hypothetical protein
MKDEPIPFTFGALLAGLASSVATTSLAFLVCGIAIPDKPGVVRLVIITGFTGFGFAVGAISWTRNTRRPPVNPPVPDPDSQPDSR